MSTGAMPFGVIRPDDYQDTYYCSKKQDKLLQAGLLPREGVRHTLKFVIPSDSRICYFPVDVSPVPSSVIFS